jgi:anionic cell wall polymer biosynthesis LytR-Cps2A-Psr (LCP) family protein
VSTIVGLPIQYYAQVNYEFIKTVTDAVGGIDVDIHTRDSRGIYDPTVGLTLPAGVNHLDGKTALKLARARNSHGGYGLPLSNFDREINQQRILTALFKKLSDNGTLNNINGALKLLDALSGNLQTNIQTSELKSAVSMAKSIDVANVKSIPLLSYLGSGSMQGQSIVLSVFGLHNYTQMQAYIAEETGNENDQ